MYKGLSPASLRLCTEDNGKEYISMYMEPEPDEYPSMYGVVLSRVGHDAYVCIWSPSPVNLCLSTE